MLETIKRILGFTSSPHLDLLVKKGAKIIDVRTRAEFNAGHVEGSINIPLNELQSIKERFSTDTVLITCCASGIRSASAMNVLRKLGYSQVYNGGGWVGLKSKVAYA